MDLRKPFIQDSSNLWAENRLLKFGFFSVVICMAFLTTALIQTNNNVRTHVIPLTAHGNLVLSASTASDDYHRAMARYVITLLGNMTAANARQQYTELLTLIHPESFSTYQSLFNQMATEIERFPAISYAVYVHDVRLLNDNTLQVNCTKSRIVGRTVSNPEAIEYLISFRLEDGRFWIIDIKEKGEGEVHAPQ